MPSITAVPDPREAADRHRVSIDPTSLNFGNRRIRHGYERADPLFMYFRSEMLKIQHGHVYFIEKFLKMLYFLAIDSLIVLFFADVSAALLHSIVFCRNKVFSVSLTEDSM